MSVSRSLRLLPLVLPLSLAIVARPAAAQTPCAASGGPDLVVADLPAPVNYASLGTLEALSIGKNYCNVGAAQANCFASTNQHPLATSGLFRLKNVGGTERFEQVGQSWVFHSFIALSAGFCCPDCQPSDGSHVGVHCSDTNSSSISGSQVGNGPRWQVNAFTGAFPFPFANPPFSGTVARRLEVDMSDLEVTGVAGAPRYFVEVLLVAPDEALAGNAANNATHRELDVTGGGSAWNFSLTGVVQRERAAIHAWKAADASVQEAEVQIPGEGKLILAWKTTQLGNGVFRYEYALYNLNSDLAAGSFSVPLPAGASASALGFHDVAYRDGDGIGNVDQSGTDWSTTIAGGAVSWATDSFAVDPNANALRWGTLYNFRFDSDAAPTSGTLTIGLFKNGGSVTVNADVPASIGLPGCSGDGSVGACPCSNSGATGRGCANSTAGSTGALLLASGAVLADPITLTDTLVLHGSGMPATATGIYLQGTALLGTGALLGDGLRCAAGILRRLAVKPASGGASQYPGPGDPSISQRSAFFGDPLLGSGATRHYQLWYRDSDASFCPDPPGKNYNVTNALTVGW